MANYTSTHTGAQIENNLNKVDSIVHVTCSTAEATTAKTVIISGYPSSLIVGTPLNVTFTYAVPANATLKINSLAAKSIYYKGAAIIAGVIAAGQTVTLVYDGNYFQLLGSGVSATYDSDTYTLKLG